MILFFHIVNTAPNYFIKLSGSDKMLSRHTGDVVASDFYTPILFEFTQTNNGDLLLKDKAKNKNLIIKDNKIVLSKTSLISPTPFEILFNGKSNFYIVNNDKCLEMENDLSSSKISQIKFKKCLNAPNQLWDILISGDRKVKLKHYIDHSHKDKYSHSYHKHQHEKLATKITELYEPASFYN
ncbi:ricin B lectin (RBL8) [Vairimorpha necatrix]|uniref:Ricin B lectin (RBL8) n=1 Tax=Vairimorpha necatrix TaxID=6039 RepID=A0AAX4JB26_9MICR